MATRRKTTTAASRAPLDARKKRASTLRGLIEEIAAGIRPADAPPRSPREITDDAARKKMAAAKKRKRRPKA